MKILAYHIKEQKTCEVLGLDFIQKRYKTLNQIKINELFTDCGDKWLPAHEFEDIRIVNEHTTIEIE